MKNLYENQSGFSVIEALLILMVVGILGFTGWYVYHTKNTTNKDYSASATSTVPTYAQKAASAPTYSYAGWKTFCSSVTNGCFKYDPNWDFQECAPQQINAQGFQDCSPTEQVDIVAPNQGTEPSTIIWDVEPYDASQPDACTQHESSFPDITYSDITKAPAVSNFFYLNLKDTSGGSAKYAYTDDLALTTGANGQPPTVGQRGALCPPAPSFLSQDGKYEITLSYAYNVNMLPTLPASQQVPPPSQTDLDIVKQTLLSFYYK